MITSIRNKFSLGLINKIFILLVIFSLMGVFSLPLLFFKKGGNGPWSLRVNGQEVPLATFMQEVEVQREKIAQFRTQYGQYADMLFQAMGMNLDPNNLASDLLTKQVLLEQLCQKLPVRTDTNFVLEKLQSKEFSQQYLSDIVPPYLFDNEGVINEKIFRLYLKKRKWNVSDILELAEKTIQRQLLIEFIGQSLYVPTFDLKALYSAQHVAKKYSMLIFSYDKYLAQAKNEEINDAQLQAFFSKKNREKGLYFIPETRVGVRWKLQPHNYDITINKEAINNYYESNKDKMYIATPAQVQIGQIIYTGITADKERPSIADLHALLLESPEQFDAFAQRYSDESTLRITLKRDQKDHPLHKAAFSLSKEGSISDIIPLADGRAIIRLEKKIAKTYKPLSDVSSDIKAHLSQEAFKKEFNKDMKNISASKALTKENIAALMDARGAKKESIEGANTGTAQGLFTIKKEGNIDFYTQDNNGYVVMLHGVKKKYTPKLEDIKAQVEEDFYNEKASLLMDTQMKKARSQLGTDSLSTVAKKYDAKVQTLDWVKPDDAKQIKKLEEQRLPIQKMLQLENIGSVCLDYKENDGLLVYLDEIAPVQEADWLAYQKSAPLKKMQEFTRILIESVIASLYRDATIESNESFETAREDYSI